MFIFSFYNTIEHIKLEEYEILSEFQSPYLILAKKDIFFYIFITNIKIPTVRIAKSYHFYEIQRNWFTLVNKVEPKLTKETLLITLQEITRQLHELEILNAFLGKLKASLPKFPQRSIRFMKIHEEDSVKYLYRDLERYGLTTFCKKQYPSSYNNYPVLNFGGDEMKFQLPFCCTDIVTEWPIQIPSNKCFLEFDVTGGISEQYNTMGMATVIILKSIDDFEYGTRVDSILSTEQFFSKDSPNIRVKIEGFKGFWFHIVMKISYQGSIHWSLPLSREEWKFCELNIKDMQIRDVHHEDMSSRLLQAPFDDVLII